MKRESWVVFVAAVALYLPTVRYGIVQDDRAIIASNPAAHSIGAALRAFDDPYWPARDRGGPLPASDDSKLCSRLDHLGRPDPAGGTS